MQQQSEIASHIKQENVADVPDTESQQQKQRQFRFSSSLEDNCSMPSLQDLLEDFDASRLEELAESLLADVTTDIEGDAPGSGHTSTKIESDRKSMLGCLVGSQTEHMESSKDINGSLNTPIKRPKYTIKEEPIDCVLPPAPIPATIANSPLSNINDTINTFNDTLLSSPAQQQQFIDVFEHQQLIESPDSPSVYTNTFAPNSNGDNSMSPMSTTATTLITTTTATPPTSTTPTNNFIDDLYESYDEETNCITMTLPDEDISNFEEVIEEVVCSDEDDEYLSQVSMLSPIATNYPSPGYSSYYAGGDIKSPISTYTDRDSAYDSLMGSPSGGHLLSICPSSDDEHPYTDELWHDSFSELFPSLA